MKNKMFEAVMQIRMLIRTIVFILKDKMTVQKAFEHSRELTKQEVDIVYFYERKNAA